MRKNTGFTLMELMVAIAIIAIAASIAIPNIVGWLPTHRLASASRAILSVLQQARLRAVKENTFVTVQFDTGNERYNVFWDNGEGAGGNPGDGRQNGTEKIFKSDAMPAGINLKDTTFADNNSVCFSNRGLPTPTPASNDTVTILNSQNINRKIEVSQTGNSTIIIP
jgi:prepilin-type N-terminal cleavage/methylation domain-containing protein